MTRIAYLGTGLLGSAFVEGALQRGDQVTVWNRTAAKAKALEALGATAALTPSDAVRGAERVHLVLTDDAVVNEVIEQLRPGLGSGVVIVDHSTTQPALTAERSKRLLAEKVAYLHCPVFIGPPAARRSLGVILVAGPRELYDRVSAGLAVQAATVEYLGERPDLAAVYKLAGNAFIIGITGLVADTLQVARGGDVSPTDAMKLFDFFNPMAILTGRAKALAAKNFNATFELTMARKDVRLMQETAGDGLLVLPGIAARMDQLIAEGEGAKDLAIIGRDAVR